MNTQCLPSIRVLPILDWYATQPAAPIRVLLGADLQCGVDPFINTVGSSTVDTNPLRDAPSAVMDFARYADGGHQITGQRAESEVHITHSAPPPSGLDAGFVFWRVAAPYSDSSTGFGSSHHGETAAGSRRPGWGHRRRETRRGQAGLGYLRGFTSDDFRLFPPTGPLPVPTPESQRRESNQFISGLVQMLITKG